MKPTSAKAIMRICAEAITAINPGRLWTCALARSGEKIESARTFVFEGAPSSNIARNLSAQLRQTVLDHTSLTEHYEGKLEWSFDIDGVQPDTSLPSIYSALEQQLGLRLQFEKTPVEVLVIDNAERPDADQESSAPVEWRRTHSSAGG